MTPDPHHFLEGLVARESAARLRLADVVSGQFLCSPGANAVAGVKRREGAAAALTDVRRTYRAHSQQSTNVESIRMSLSEVHSRWSDGCRAPARTGADWTEYLAGGLDALRRLIDDTPVE